MSTVLITGASSGIGKAAARLFAQKGCKVAVGYSRGKDRAEALCAEITAAGGIAAPFCADVADEAAVKAMFRAVENTLGSVDILVNNAGIAQQKLFTDITDADFDRMFGVNVRGVFHCCREAIPHMVHRKSGRIINISSMWGIRGASCEVHYSASKAAVIGLTKALAKELGPSGICVNCIAPGVIDTPMNASFDADTMRELCAETPLMRIGTPEEVAAAIWFFASPEASFITGQVLGADGGFAV